ncbi:GCG_CRPN prefix-to-repeats domain-containing protein [Methylobacterium nodulans]|uniref:Sulfur globule protein n=1 Tax=Methylobacterium nodulans (strain LMG 21967 / CNCM I-2342 / ORS 2060) TaxID=460265 RepID=B8IKE4_METNO|nr:hypothetical protein [Methylobacterium nodulans]ACL61929.1 conserved hypothetical protein [Methylobacterium nodulans ORS 2060]
MINTKLLALAAVAGGLGFASAASAAPGAVAPAGVIAGDTQVETVAYGCGPGWAPNAWGHCRPIYRPYYGYGYGYRPYGYYRPAWGYGYRPHGIGIRIF